MAKKVLIVDDDKEMIRVLKKGLKKYSRRFSILTAADGINAVEMLKRNTVSLVITDMEIPRMDGLSLLAHVTEHYPDISTIIINDYTAPAKEKLAREKGAVGYIEKPLIIEDLVKEITTILKKEEDGGVLHSVAPGTFLQLVEMEQKTCTIRLIDDKSGSQGVLFFKEGELLDARTDGLHGIKAAYEILAWDEATLAIQEACSLEVNNIHADLQAVLLEAMRLKDEGGKEEKLEVAIEIEEEEPDLADTIETEEKISKEPKFGDAYQANLEPSTEGGAISYTMAESIIGALVSLKDSVFASSFLAYSFKIITLFVMVGLMGFLYLIITMETNKDLLEQIDQAKGYILSKQESLYKLDEEIHRLYAAKTSSIKNNEFQLKVMELDLKISELEEQQEKIRTETEIQQKAIEENQIKLEEMKRRSFFDRLLEDFEAYLPSAHP